MTPTSPEAKVSADRPVLESMSLEPASLAGFDAVILATDHACLDYRIDPRFGSPGGGYAWCDTRSRRW